MDSNNIDSDIHGKWRSLCDELSRRTREPFQFPTFVFYSFLAIVVFAGAGIWFEVLKIISSEEMVNYNGVVTAVAAFCLALIGSASNRLILLATETSNKLMASFSYSSSVLVFVIVIILRYLYEIDKISWCIPVVFTIIPIWIWWIANGDDLIYRDINIDAASGGNTSRNLHGSLKGFNVD